MGVSFGAVAGSYYRSLLQVGERDVVVGLGCAGWRNGGPSVLAEPTVPLWSMTAEG